MVCRSGHMFLSEGYTLRHLHETKVEERLDSIEKAMKSNYDLEHAEFRKLVRSGSSSTAACVATAGTTLIIGYTLGWQGGRWYANRKFRKEQMKLLGQMKPKRWQLKFFRRLPWRPKLRETETARGTITSETLPKDMPASHNSAEASHRC